MATYKDLKSDNTELKQTVDDLVVEIESLRQAHAKNANGMAEMFQTHLEHNKGIENQVNEHLDKVQVTHELDKESAIATAKDEQKDANTDEITCLRFIYPWQKQNRKRTKDRIGFSKSCLCDLNGICGNVCC